MAYEEISLKMGERLKEMRNNKGLSHVRLKEEIKEKTGVDFSKSILEQYEISDKYHAKAYANNGMSVKNLRALAEFYGVSTDYLLGITDEPIKESSARAVCQYTGLSGKCVELLHSLDPDSLEANFIRRFFDDLLVHHKIHESVVQSILEAVLAYDIAERERNFIRHYDLHKDKISEQDAELSPSQQRIVDDRNGVPHLEEDGRYTIPAEDAYYMYCSYASGSAQGSIDQVIVDLCVEFARKPHLLPLTLEKVKSFRWEVNDDDPIEYFDEDVFNEFMTPNSEE